MVAFTFGKSTGIQIRLQSCLFFVGNSGITTFLHSINSVHPGLD